MLKHGSSAGSLSSPPSAVSDAGSPNRYLSAGRANIEMDEIVVDPSAISARFGIMGSQAASAQVDVPLTAAGQPRKKPGRKPGTTVKPKVEATGDAPKVVRKRKTKDPNAPPPVPRKRKIAATATEDTPQPMDVDSASVTGSQPKGTELTSTKASADVVPLPATTEAPAYARKVPRREAPPGSMQSILNDDSLPASPVPVPTYHAPATTKTTTRQMMFDPVRGNYDPVRETMMARDPYGTASLGSPRGPSQVPNRASASPSIASLVDPPLPTMQSPGTTLSYHNAGQSRAQPPSPSHVAPERRVSQTASKTAVEIKRPPPPPPPAPKAEKAEKSEKTRVPLPTGSTTTAATNSRWATTASVAAAAAPVQSKKVAAMAQQERASNKKASTSSSSPKVSGTRDALPAVHPVPDRSILDFGKAQPGEECATNIELHVPLNGETNKYVNFMRMAEERYGWDALNPHLAASRDRKARIAAATAALEKTGSGKDTGDEMDSDMQSDPDNSNVEMGGVANGATSTPDGVPAKPVRKKRSNKEDEYDKGDDFVDDSEMLWEEQAAASRDGFFVYSGPLIPEVEKTLVPDGPTKRGRGGRGGRGGAAARGGGTARGEAVRRAGGPGSRGGTARKPRITKLEKEQRDREKAEREKLAQLTSKSGATASSSSSQSLLTLAASGQSATAGAS